MYDLDCCVLSSTKNANTFEASLGVLGLTTSTTSCLRLCRCMVRRRVWKRELVLSWSLLSSGAKVKGVTASRESTPQTSRRNWGLTERPKYKTAEKPSSNR
eukprot:c19434_g1_i1.p2 GENE.c19434_g1_i1~~c19434_g1_i1.p2  ORF type:complete len:101 (-),score=16.36 c19434_g1_i1:73-375(-)